MPTPQEVDQAIAQLKQLRQEFDDLKSQFEAAKIEIVGFLSSNERQVLTQFVAGNLNVRAAGAIPGTPSKLTALVSVQPVR
jgi:FixJ family two-component response regulator